VEIAVFRAVQEAINNVVRHAKAETVLIEVAVNRGVLEIDIEDDGLGFDVLEVGGPSPSGRGLGLLGLHERMELIGGASKVTSSPGQGTRVSLNVPITVGS
jgi:signal transduction histidine kinase